MKLREIKRELRILGIDDAPFSKFKDKECLVVATIFRGGSYMDGLLSAHVRIDGEDSTKKIIKIANASRHMEQLRCIMIDGIALAGFNILDIQKLSRETGLPVIVFMRKMPDFKKIETALKKADKKTASKKFALMKRAGRVYRIKNKGVYYQIAGISEKKAAEILKLSATHALVPEPLRIAHIIASGIALGESHGRA